MELEREMVGEVTVVTIKDENLDASNSKQFKRSFEQLIEPRMKVVIDMNRIQFVDSGGISALLSLVRQFHAAAGEAKLCSVDKPVRALFELVRMHRVYEIFNTREEAVKAFEV